MIAMKRGEIKEWSKETKLRTRGTRWAKNDVQEDETCGRVHMIKREIARDGTEQGIFNGTIGLFPFMECTFVTRLQGVLSPLLGRYKKYLIQIQFRGQVFFLSTSNRHHKRDSSWTSGIRTFMLTAKPINYRVKIRPVMTKREITISNVKRVIVSFGREKIPKSARLAAI
jgi:hypothetical protein